MGLLLLAWALFSWLDVGPAAVGGGVLGLAAVGAWALVVARAYVLAYLTPTIEVAGAAALMALVAVRVLSLPRNAALLLAASFALRLGLVVHPAFPCIDVALHAHRLVDFREGRIVTNIVGNREGRGCCRCRIHLSSTRWPRPLRATKRKRQSRCGL